MEEKIFALLLAQLQPDVLSVAALMHSPVVTITSDQSVAEACRVFRNFNLKRLPVLRPIGELVREDGDERHAIGIIDRAISEKAVGHGLGDQLVSVCSTQGRYAA